MLVKWAIVAIFLLALISLSSGLFFLLKDEKDSKSLLASLKLRVGLCVLLVLVVIYGFWSGELVTASPWSQIHQ